MRSLRRVKIAGTRSLRAAALIGLATAFTVVGTAAIHRFGSEAHAQASPAGPGPGNEEGISGVGTASSNLLHVPVGQLQIGGASNRPNIPNPVANDPDAAQRGMRYFNQFNCVGCHAPNGAGGMGPALSNIKFIYGREPENIYLTIVQGRPKGMPSWGGRLPDNVIWDIVAYIRSISQAPSKEWGQTVSVQSFQKQQVPTEYLQSATPWKYMTPFTFGQKPFTKPKSGPPPAPQK